jgi:YVTN family beta-propeller protein
MNRCTMLALSLGVLLGIGCKKDPVSPPIPPAPPPIVRAVYVLNEGNFGDAAGARLTLYDVERDTTYTDVFESANGNSHLGSVGDDMVFWNGKAYIVMSGSENLDVISLADHRLVQTQTFAGSTPHDLLLDTLRNKIYITRLFGGSLLVANLQTLSVIDTIPVGDNPLCLTLVNTRLFVCNSGYGASRNVSVIDVLTDSVIATLPLSDGPSSAVLASDGRLWVTCTGNPYVTPATPAKLFALNPQTLAVEDSVLFAGNLAGPMAAGTDGSLYVVGITPGDFYGGPIHRVSLAQRIPHMDFIPGTYYNLAVDEGTGDIYAADAKGFVAAGEVFIYSNSGVRKNHFTAQRGPSVIRFKR